MPQEQPETEEESRALPADAAAEGSQSGSAREDEAMEFKPVVKYAAIGAGLLLLAGVEYATYSVGYDRGFDVATASGRVQNAVNAAAVENLTHFMQMSVADDEVLVAAVKNRDQSLAWIHEPAVRQEAEWTLAQSLIDRGLVTEGAEMLSELVPAAPQTEIWARRATLAAGAFAKAGQEESAIAYYRLAAGIYAALGQPEPQIAVLSEMVELLAASPSPMEEVIATLDALQQDAAASGDAAKGLRSTILAYMGGLHRRSGDREASLRCFEQALADMPADKMPELVGAAVSYAMALLEKGDSEKAERLLRDSVSRLAATPAEISFQVAAMRELARLEQDRGHTEEALALLYRAEGAAAGRVPADNPFWSCLYDQRGWLNLLKQLYGSAEADFAKATERTEQPDLLAQPLEGLGRCCLAQGKSDEAIQYLTRAAELRRQHLPAAKQELGRVCLLLGQAQDMAGMTHAATASYEQAVSLLPQESQDLHFAEMSLAYAYSQVGRWSDAARIWSSLQEVFAEDPVRRDEVKAQLALCRRNGAGTQPAANADEEQSPEAATPARPAPASPARRTRRPSPRRR